MEYRKAASRMGWGMVAFFLVSQIAQTLLLMLFDIIAPQVSESMAGMLLIGDIGIYCIGLPCLLAICKKIPNTETSTPPPQQKMTAGLLVKTLCMAFAAMYLTNFLYMLVMGVFSSASGHSVDENALLDVIVQNNLIERIVLFCIVPPILEELVFRKYLYTKIGNYGDNAFILVSGLCFGMFHGNLNQFFYAFALGSLLAWLYVTTGNVVWGMIIHTIINLMGSIVAPMTMENETLGLFITFFVLSVTIAGAIIFFRSKRGGMFAPPITQEQQPRLFVNTMFNWGMALFTVLFLVVSIIILAKPFS